MSEKKKIIDVKAAQGKDIRENSGDRTFNMPNFFLDPAPIPGAGRDIMIP